MNGTPAEDFGERLAVNAASVRLFKGEYRNSGDRHNDAVLVRDHLGVQHDQILELRAKLAAAAKDTERLDFLEKQSSALYANGLEYGKFAFRHADKTFGPCFHKVRDCIDAALAAAPADAAKQGNTP